MLQYGTHYAGYVNNLNAALANATIEIPANASGLTGASNHDSNAILQHAEPAHASKNAGHDFIPLNETLLLLDPLLVLLTASCCFGQKGKSVLLFLWLLTACFFPGLIKSVLLLPAPLNNSIRNQGGGAWNHALYFKHLAPAGSNSTRATAISTQLQSAIMTSFGSVGNMTAELTRAATGVFGSGWAWLCVAGALSTNAAARRIMLGNQKRPACNGLVLEYNKQHGVFAEKQAVHV